MQYTMKENEIYFDHWDIVNPDGTKLVTVTNKSEAEKLLIKLNNN